ncbi:hypothetical protein EXIGLDRAFT_205509 [Exidia glandulosa HHB12029]|uniref:Uncharacterized protein n=1 Tax=Exidia glandulosa HHB12029 TaxID=1314781 RepID=A0A165MV11_EXIGL|nr:hypothetical protein EXIGLDRAFT_205509 [Exidia glandulosa HHB12029]
MVVHDTVDTPVIRSPSYPLPSPAAHREREPGIPEQDEDEEELLAPTVFVDDVDADADQDEEAEGDEEEEPHHHLHSENDPIQNGVPPGRAAADEPLPPLSTAPGPMHDEPEQDYPLPEEEVHAGPPPPGDMPVHERFACDGCGMGPIIGIMFMCMHPDCPEYVAHPVPCFCKCSWDCSATICAPTVSTRVSIRRTTRSSASSSRATWRSCSGLIPRATRTMSYWDSACIPTAMRLRRLRANYAMGGW